MFKILVYGLGFNIGQTTTVGFQSNPFLYARPCDHLSYRFHVWITVNYKDRLIDAIHES